MSTKEGKANTKGTKEGNHCVRCHESFVPGRKGDKCIVWHDTDLFEGSRNGTSWYTGTLGCCGADYRFHRHYSDSAANPEYCFEGEHTTDPAEVEYNNSTIKYCDEEKCGKELQETTKEAYEKQMKAAKEASAAKKARRKEEKGAKRAAIGELQSQGKRREARRLRAEVLGMDMEEDELNSDVDPDGCEEFDYASDSSLVPPWEMEDSD